MRIDETLMRTNEAKPKQVDMRSPIDYVYTLHLHPFNPYMMLILYRTVMCEELGPHQPKDAVAELKKKKKMESFN